MPGTGLPKPRKPTRRTPARTPRPRPPTPRTQQVQPQSQPQPRIAQAQSPAARNPGAGPLEGHDPLSYIPESPPDASYPSNPYASYTGLDSEWSPDASMTAQSASLQRRQQELGQRNFDQERGDIQHDLAKQLEALNQRRTYQTEDARRKVTEMQRQLPLAQRRLGGQYAGRGLASSGAKNEAQGEVARQTDEAVTGTERDLDRDMAEAQSQEGALRNQAARQERELNDAIEADRLQREADELQEKVSAAKDAHSRAQAQVKAQRAGVEAKRAEASAWMGARVNELMNSKMSEDQARSTALSEARQFFTGVPDTYLAGRFKPSTEKKTRLGVQATESRYGQPISLERGNRYTKERKAAIRKGAFYKENAASARAYLESVGGRGSAMGYLKFMEDSLMASFGWDEEQARKKIADYAPQLSFILAENNLS